MNFTPLALDPAYIIEPDVQMDDRGHFYRVYCKNEFSKLGYTGEWVQLNHSFTNTAGTIRGIHFQKSPYGEIKLVRCIAGRVYDVIADLREGSPTFLQHVAVELSAENRKMLLIPKGFAHGFQTIVDNCQLMYMHSEFYNPAAEGGVRFDDPRLDIKWPMVPTNISARDKDLPYMNAQFSGIRL